MQLLLTIPHLETLGMLRSHYTRQLNEAALTMGKSTRRKHAHMHTQTQPGINSERAAVLLKTFTLPEAIAARAVEDLDSEDYDCGVTMEEIDAEFDKLDDQVFAPADGDGLNPGVSLNEVYDLSELENIRAGTVIATVDKELDLSKEKDAGGEIWDESSLLRSLGVGN